MQTQFDYIIVGAGSAGCVLANRLSADPDISVLLVEAGPEPDSPYIRIPLGLGRTLADPRYAWHYTTEPEPGTGGQSRIWLRGKTLGGSSAVNGMVYCHGQPQDYDDWEAKGCDGWGWETFRKAFIAIEDHELGASEHRGSGGPLHISIQKYRSPLTEALLSGCAALGTAVKQDINEPDQEGVGYTPLTIRDGRRVSAYEAFVKPVRHRRRNLTIRTDVLVERVVVEDGRATGIDVRVNRGRERWNGREIILSAGTIGSPKILQLSGIGPASKLVPLGIGLVADRPGVGQNLSEHKAIWQEYRLRRNMGHNPRLRGWRFLVSAMQYLAFRSGPMSTSVDINGFIRTRPDLDRPDAQIQFWSLTARKGAATLEPELFPAINAGGWMLRPESRGSILIRSADAAALPAIYPNFLTSDYDRQVLVGVFRYFRRLFAQPALAGMIDQEVLPGSEVQTDEEIIESCRLAENGYHATGTCRMGSDPDAIVDPRLRVRGVENLRVMDCSVMPTQVSSGVNGPIMAMAWHAASLILEDRRG
ncbi:MAG: GMC family oxidoreductase N-terminal domain-containing protein [Sphingomonadaceae bacterium]